MAEVVNSDFISHIMVLLNEIKCRYGGGSCSAKFFQFRRTRNPIVSESLEFLIEKLTSIYWRGRGRERKAPWPRELLMILSDYTVNDFVRF